jgi:hypothetical protein
MRRANHCRLAPSLKGVYTSEEESTLPRHTTGHVVIVGQGKVFDLIQNVFRQDVGIHGDAASKPPTL